MKNTELEDWQYLKAKMRDEGFHYCFTKYSEWSEIKDPYFQKLKKQYIKISLLLEDYINQSIEATEYE